MLSFQPMNAIIILLLTVKILFNKFIQFSVGQHLILIHLFHKFLSIHQK